MLTRSAKSLEEFCGYYPTLATIVTAKSNGRENAMAVAWHAIVSTNPPAYGVSVSPKRFTHGLITESGKFAVNFLPAEETELIAAVGGCSAERGVSSGRSTLTNATGGSAVASNARA